MARRVSDCSVDGCEKDAVMTVIGTGLKLCADHAKEYNAALIAARLNEPQHATQRGGHSQWVDIFMNCFPHLTKAASMEMARLFPHRFAKEEHS